MRYFVLLSAVMMLLLGGCRGSKPDQISAQMAYVTVASLVGTRVYCQVMRTLLATAVSCCMS